MKKLFLSVFLIVIAATGANASQIERACLQSDRQAAGRVLCGCIQDVADLTLSDSDQKLAASFFRDPQKAAETRQSDSSRNEKFWDRYKEFGEAAKEFCKAG